MVYGTYNELVTGANLNQLITGGPHIVVKPSMEELPVMHPIKIHEFHSNSPSKIAPLV